MMHTEPSVYFNGEHSGDLVQPAWRVIEPIHPDEQFTNQRGSSGMTTEDKIEQLKRDAQELGDTEAAQVLQGIIEVLAELDRRIRDAEEQDIDDTIVQHLVRVGVM